MRASTRPVTLVQSRRWRARGLPRPSSPLYVLSVRLFQETRPVGLQLRASNEHRPWLHNTIDPYARSASTGDHGSPLSLSPFYHNAREVRERLEQVFDFLKEGQAIPPKSRLFCIDHDPFEERVDDRLETNQRIESPVIPPGSHLGVEILPDNAELSVQLDFGLIFEQGRIDPLAVPLFLFPMPRLA